MMSCMPPQGLVLRRTFLATCEERVTKSYKSVTKSVTNRVIRVLQVCYKFVTTVLQGCYEGVTRELSEI
jgi:hypothetical protein